MKKKYVIIGNSAAGIGGVTGIRKEDKAGSILLISNEKYHTYSRPLISYWLQGKVTRENMSYRDDRFYEDNQCETRLGVAVTNIDANQKQLILDNGETVEYEKLLISTGSVPFVPPIKGQKEAQNCFTFTTMKAAEGIKAILNDQSRVVILGAGLIGLKAAEAMINQCKSLHVIDLADKILPSILDLETAEYVKTYLEEKGMVFHLQTQIDKIEDQKTFLSDDAILDYDILVLAVGTRPATSLAEKAELKTARGIVTDTQQLTSKADIYAAGDCTMSYDMSAEMDKNMAILPNAYMQGEVAGLNMAGKATIFEKAFPINSLGLLGMHIFTAGDLNGECKSVTDGDDIKKFYFKENYLKGFVLIGDFVRPGIYANLIRQQTDCSTIDMETMMKTPQLAAFSHNERFKKLSAAH